MKQKRSSDIDLLTLTIAAVASAVAAYVTSKVWAGGTLISAAFFPVIVALVKEALARPVDAVTSLRGDRRTGEQPVRENTPLHPPVTVHGRSGRRWVRVGIVSGLAAFVLVVALFTIPELVAGNSLGRDKDSATTFFGGTKRASPKSEDAKDAPSPETGATATPAPADEEATATPTASPTVTASPAPTVTATPAPSTTPAP